MTESTVPRPALLLGLSGLLPSVAMLLAMIVLPEWRGAAAGAGLAYGALIASFVGGAWWGLAAARAKPSAMLPLLAMSVLPSLAAWPALLIPPAGVLLVLAAVFAILLPTDRLLLRQGVAPAWWLGLRMPLSLGMAVLHAAAGILLLLTGPVAVPPG